MSILVIAIVLLVIGIPAFLIIAASIGSARLSREEEVRNPSFHQEIDPAFSQKESEKHHKPMGGLVNQIFSERSQR